jgi:hypothetical protein
MGVVYKARDLKRDNNSGRLDERIVGDPVHADPFSARKL